MKSIILSWALVAVCTLMTLPVQAQDAVKLEIADGLYDAGLRAKMEKSTSALLTEINKAFKENRALNLVSLGLTDTAERGLSALWRIHISIVMIRKSCNPVSVTEAGIRFARFL